MGGRRAPAGGGPPLAYLVPDFQNPTGPLMTTPQRAEYASLLAATGTVAVVDEAHQSLALEGQEMPARSRPWPRARHPRQREQELLGRAAARLDPGPARAPGPPAARRTALDLGSPVLEQLVAGPPPGGARGDAHLATGPGCSGQRDHLVAESGRRLPGWRFTVPSAGWRCGAELPGPGATDLAGRLRRSGLVGLPRPGVRGAGRSGLTTCASTAEPEGPHRGVRRPPGAWEVV